MLKLLIAAIADPKQRSQLKIAERQRNRSQVICKLVGKTSSMKEIADETGMI